MSEENTQDVTPATLSEGEAVIPADKVEEVAAVIEEPKTNVEEVAEDLGVVTSEPVVVEETENVISSPKADKAPKPKKPSLAPVANGVLGSSSAEKKEKVVAQPQADESEKVAIFSTRNVSWTGVGKVVTGYNIVKESEAKKWLTRSHVRLATPDEVAKEFGK